MKSTFDLPGGCKLPPVSDFTDTLRSTSSLEAHVFDIFNYATLVAPVSI